MSAATPIDSFVVACVGDDPNEFITHVEQWESNGRVLVSIYQIDPYTEKQDILLLDKVDVLRLADQLRGH